MNKQEYKSAAVLTIKDADKMTVKGRRDIARWLQQQALDLVDYGQEYNTRFRARYRYPDGK